jgi:hypothetical protein
MKVVAFEGDSHPDVITYATPCVKSGGSYFNPLTGDKISKRRYDEYVNDKVLFEIKNSDEFECELPAYMTLVVVNVPAVNSRGLYWKSSLWSDGDFSYDLFTDDASFSTFTNNIALEIIALVDSKPAEYKWADELVSIGLTLDFSHGALNAYGVWFAPLKNRDAALRMARACLRTNEQRKEFEETWNKLRNGG